MTVSSRYRTLPYDGAPSPGHEHGDPNGMPRASVQV